MGKQPYFCYNSPMSKGSFDWDTAKDLINQEKHGLSFTKAQYAFSDPNRIIARDLTHSDDEDRFYCFGQVGEGIATVRFTYRDNVIRIFGAGYWRKGKQIYELENQIHK
jgi:uncharacterized DUF497 family protein